jgi:hypothetical protein
MENPRLPPPTTTIFIGPPKGKIRIFITGISQRKYPECTAASFRKTVFPAARVFPGKPAAAAAQDDSGTRYTI